VVRNVVRGLGDPPGLGLEAGTHYHASIHGVWGFAIISSRTVIEALELALRHFELSFSFSMIISERTHDQVRVTFDESGVPADLRPFLIERDLAAAATIEREVLSAPLPASDYAVALPEPAYVDRYEEIVGNRPRFDATRTSITFALASLDVPMPQANPQVALMCEQECIAVMRRRHQRVGLAGAVRDALTRRLCDADQYAVAADLHVSVRTLRRRLTEEGTSYRELVAETAGLLADELLATGLTVEDVAHRLGYCDASAFNHAFKQWKGTTPGAYARSLRAR
jgi:AraC-like DNA-binding protein